ncbi:hypothetical protein [Staphylococcus debuckii]|uniref:Uncharacterized protein n=1 Tax=Staphylococcus debuckii TaxID=2044912 RepID=A0ABU9EWW7_9STAP
MNERYVKVVILYTLSSLVPSVLFSSKCVSNGFLRWGLRTVAGCGIFSAGLKFMVKQKNKKQAQ